MSDLATLRTRVALILGDTTNVRYTTNMLDEAFRISLGEYSIAYPQIKTATHLATAGRIQSLTALNDLEQILKLEFPFDPADPDPQPYAYGFYHFWQDGVVKLDLFNSPTVPALGDSIRVTYAAPHILKNLDGALTTSIPPAHFTPIVNGTAGHAALTRSQNMVEAYGQRPDEVNKLKQWATGQLAIFQVFLIGLVHTPPPGPPFGVKGQSWKLDRYDN